MTLRVEESRDGGRDLRGIFVNASSRGGKSLAVTAEGGEFLATADPDVIILRLRTGPLVHNMPGYSAPRVLSFEAPDLPIALPQTEAFPRRGGRDRELTTPELVRTGV